MRLRWKMYTLGVISGHWDLRRQDSAQDSFISATEDEEIDRLNTGIAIVTPIQEVLRIINGKSMMKVRRKAERVFALEHQPTSDPIISPKAKKQKKNSKGKFP